MAMIWYMTVNCGESQESARALAEKFDKSAFHVPTAGTVTLTIDVELNDWRETGWRCHIYPSDWGGLLNAHGGPSDEKEAADLDAAAKVLYSRLRAVSGYGFALFACE